MTSPSHPRITVGEVTFELVVTRKRVKNVNARLRGSTMLVSAPSGIPTAELERVIAELARTLVRRRHAPEINGAPDLTALARRVAARFPSPPRFSAVAFSTTQRSRWGSYSALDGTIRLHAALRAMPAWVLEAVVAHELAHAFHRHHSAAFWALVRSVCPDSERARSFLAGVSWLAGRWDTLPAVDRAQLAIAAEDSGGDA
jgi:predicted metal-dependent hydrolase